MRWDIISAVLTCTSMLAVGHRKWQGWGLAFLNSVAVCILAVHVAPKQWALIPPNAFCLLIYTRNLINWRREDDNRKTTPTTDCEGRSRVLLRVWRRLHHRYGLHAA
jgi:hypothetical protein